MKKQIISLLLVSSIFANDPLIKETQEKAYEAKIDPIFITLDPNFSPISSSQNMFSLHQALSNGLDHLYRLDQTNAQDILTRAAEVFLGWMPLNHLAMVTQHEVFGHGYRIRDVGQEKAKVKGYTIDLPPPYGPGGGATMYQLGDKMGISDFLAINIGGMEGTMVMANSIREKWLEQGKIDGRMATLYPSARLDATRYTLLMSPQLEHAGFGHDTETYFLLLHLFYPGSKMSVGNLKLLSLLNLLDPWVYASYVATWNYIATGQTSYSTKGLEKLPSFRFGYAPYGPELYLEKFFLLGDKPIHSYVKGGAFADHQYFGIGASHPQLFAFGGHKFGLALDGWFHPKLVRDFEITEAKLKRKTIGLASSLTYRFESEKIPLSTHLQIGVKSAGYLPGESLDAAPMIRGGLSLKF